MMTMNTEHGKLTNENENELTDDIKMEVDNAHSSTALPPSSLNTSMSVSTSTTTTSSGAVQHTTSNSTTPPSTITHLDIMTWGIDEVAAWALGNGYPIDKQLKEQAIDGQALFLLTVEIMKQAPFNLTIGVAVKFIDLVKKLRPLEGLSHKVLWWRRSNESLRPTIQAKVELIQHTHKVEEEIYRSCPLLREPEDHPRYPIATMQSTTETMDKAQWGPFYYYPPLLGGALTTLQQELGKKSGDNPKQENLLLALYQLTRFGKTKLCYSLGFTRFVTIIRWQDLNSGADLSFKPYIANSIDIMRIANLSSQADCQTVGELVLRNQKLVTIWLLCYVELLRLLHENPTFAECSTIKKFEYFLRISSNGQAKECINKIFENLIEHLETGYQEYVAKAIQRAKEYDMVFVFDDFLPSAAELFVGAFPHQPDLINANADGSVLEKIGERQLKEREPTSLESRRDEEERRKTSLFYSFVSAAEDFAVAAVPSILVSTQFRALRYMLNSESKNESSRNRLAFLELAPTSEFLTVTHMMKFICTNLKIFDLDPNLDEQKLVLALGPYEGRNGFFFDLFWQPLLSIILKNLTMQPVELYNSMLDMLNGSSLTRLDNAISGYIEKFVRGDAQTQLLRRLYYFQVMHGGYASFTRAENDAVNAGFAFLVEARQDKLLTRMFQEPRVRYILFRDVNDLLPNGQINTQADLIKPDQDLIYQEIDNFHSNKGLAGEEYAMRLFMRLAATKRSLYHVLHGADCGVDAKSVAAYVRFSAISYCGTATELGISELEMLLNPPSNVQLRSAYGKVDVVTPLEWLENTPEELRHHRLPPASSQIRNYGQHITPSLFYTCNGTDGALASLDPRNFFPSSPAERAKFQEEYASRDLYVVYIRVIVSTMGFNKTVKDEITAYNRSARALNQPIFLVTLGDYIADQQVPNDLLGRERDVTPSRASEILWSLDNFTIPAKLQLDTTTTTTTIPPRAQSESRFFRFHKRPNDDKDSTPKKVSK